MEAHQPGALLPGAEAVFHQAVPDLSRRAELGDLLKEIAVRVEEEAQAGPEFVHVKPAAPGPLHVFHAVIDGEGQLLQRGRAGLADVVSADGDRVEFGGEFGAELKSIDYQAHGSSSRIEEF